MYEGGNFPLCKETMKIDKKQFGPLLEKGERRDERTVRVITEPRRENFRSCDFGPFLELGNLNG
jgi:hypothetical protein